MTSFYSRRLICVIFVLCMALSVPSAAVAVDDCTPPTISEISIDKQEQTVRPDETFTVRYKAQDASGIKRTDCNVCSVFVK